jgi:hypothetical protein
MAITGYFYQECILKQVCNVCVVIIFYYSFTLSRQLTIVHKERDLLLQHLLQGKEYGFVPSCLRVLNGLAHRKKSTNKRTRKTVSAKRGKTYSFPNGKLLFSTRPEVWY